MRLWKHGLLALGLSGSLLIAGTVSAAAAAPDPEGKRYESKYRDNDRGDRRDGNGRYTIRCNSNGYDFERCRVNGNIDRVSITARISDASCRLGDDWGFTRDAVWVRNGCRAEFAVFFGNNRGRTGYEQPRYRDNNYQNRDYRRDDYYYRDGREHRDDRYGYRGEQRAVDKCISRATDRLHRAGYRRVSLDRVGRAHFVDGEWRIRLQMRVGRGARERYPSFGCTVYRGRVRLDSYDYGNNRGRRY